MWCDLFDLQSGGAVTGHRGLGSDSKARGSKSKPRIILTMLKDKQIMQWSLKLATLIITIYPT